MTHYFREIATSFQTYKLLTIIAIVNNRFTVAFYNTIKQLYLLHSFYASAHHVDSSLERSTHRRSSS